jgi:hypothetical protein
MVSRRSLKSDPPPLCVRGGLFVLAAAAALQGGCFDQKAEVLTTSDRRPKESPRVAIAGSIVVERAGELELCVDGSLPPLAAEHVPNGRQLLAERLTRAAGSGDVVDKSCSQRFRLRPELATCTTSENAVVDGSVLTLSVVTRYYRVSACEHGSAPELTCKKAQGKWELADANDPGVAAERFRQGASKVLEGVDRHVLKPVDRVSGPH